MNRDIWNDESIVTASKRSWLWPTVAALCAVYGAALTAWVLFG